MKTILLVEDLPDVKETAEETLKRSGFFVYTAENRKGAIRMFNRHGSKIDAVLTDCRLDDDDTYNKDGVELANYFKALNPLLPVIGLSAYQEFAEQKDELGFDLFFEKSSTDPKKNFFMNIETIRNLIDIKESQSLLNLPEKLLQLKSKYQITDYDFRTLIQHHCLRPSTEKALLAIHNSFEDNMGIDKSDMVACYPKIVDPNENDYENRGLQNPFILIITKFKDLFMAELYGFSMIYTYGDTEFETINDMILLLEEYYDDFQNSASRGNSHDVIKFGNYLRELFDPR